MPRKKSITGRLALLTCAALAMLASAPSGQAQTTSDQSSAKVGSPASPSDVAKPETHAVSTADSSSAGHPTGESQLDFMSMLFVFMLATFIGIGVIRRVSRLLHTPLMSLTNAISAISVVGAIIVAGGTQYPVPIRIMGAIALFASMTNIISGFLITDRMLKMFKTREEVKA
jgi:NAD(P) transhydrogenase subunit alpha